MNQTPLSPDSEQSIYFDAPIANFPMASPPPGPSVSDNPARGGNGGAKNDAKRESSSGWLEAIDDPLTTNDSNARSSSPTHGTTNTLQRSSSRRSLFTDPDGHPIGGSTFIAGAATTGPNSNALPDDELTSRGARADASLTPKQRSKIEKEEAKEGKRISKVIKNEGKTEKQALDIAIKEFADLQKAQAAAIKEEAKANASRAKVQAEFQKQEAHFLAARVKYEAAQGRLAAENETLEIIKNKAKDATEKLQDKALEVDGLRTMYGVDERERAAKLAAVTGKPETSGGSGCVVF